MFALLKIFSLLATPCIAIAVAVVAWRQWETARQKLMLDLFKDRLEIYQKVLSAIRLIEGPGRPEDAEPFILLHEAKDEAQFLYGPEVADYIKQLIRAAAELNRACTEYDAGNPKGEDLAQIMYDTSIYLSAAREHLPKQLQPYLRMNQRLPGTEPVSIPKYTEGEG